jgi:hypothetical protein
VTISKPGVKLFRNTDLEELEQAVNEFCNDRWVYGFEVQVAGGETTVMVIYMRRPSWLYT